MRRTFRVIVGVAIAALASAPAAAAQSGPAKDYAETALNVIPSGQYGGVPVPEDADVQARMYDGLTPLFDDIGKADLTTYFKSEAFGVDTAEPSTIETVPREGVQIVRDSYNVPHVTGVTHDDGIWAAGWIAASDRGLLLEQARYNARVAAIDAPGLSAIGLVAGLANFEPSAATEAVVAQQTEVLEAAGKEGRAVLHDIDVYIEGINAYLAANSPETAPWTRNDVYAVNALKNQFLGTGGGDEARRSQFLGGLQQRLGARKGKQVFDDLRQFKNPELPTSVDGRFPYGKLPARAEGSVVLDPDSYTETPAASRRAVRRYPAAETQASNTLMITAERSKTGDPLMVGGPQIGYFYPGLTYEIDMHAGDLQWRGATSAPFPGYLLIGRGQDFATTLTSASGDVIDQYVERLCGGSDEQYRYKGECLAMERFDAGTLDGEPVSFLRTVHGPVTGYATVHGERVAISSKRSSYGRDTLDLLFNRRLSNGQVRSPQSFFEAAAKTPQTFNSFYIDSEHVAEYTSGLLPIRDEDLDPGLPALGTGKYEWRGFLSAADHPQGIDPEDGTMTNWNQAVARGFGAADDQWGRTGSVGRVDLLDYNLRRLADKRGRFSLASVTAAMNAAATQDVRAIVTVPLLKRLLRGAEAPTPQAQAMLEALITWKQRGGSRLDRDLDGSIDDAGAAIMDVAWTKIADATMAPRLGTQLDELDTLFSRFEAPPGGQYAGWYQYFDRDIRALLGEDVKQPFRVAYCGRGKLGACQTAVWNAIAAAGAELEVEQGTPDPNGWRADATAERIEFVPGLLPYTMRYANRPSGIQQVISFDGHR